MKRLTILSCALALLLGSSSAIAARGARFIPVHARAAAGIRGLRLQAPPPVDTTFRDSLRVPRDSAFVDSTARDSTRHPKPNPTPPPRRPRLRMRMHIVSLARTVSLA
jgi:hypothetical protein